MEKKESINNKPAVFKGITESNKNLKELPYGGEWRKTCAIILLLRNQLDSSRIFSDKTDWEVANSTCNLLEETVLEDRIGWCGSDLDKISKKGRDESWDNKRIEQELLVLQKSYYMETDDLNKTIERWKLSKLKIVSIPDPKLSIREEDRLSCRYYHLMHLSLVSIKKSKDGFEIDLDPLYDGGIDSLAYPVKNAKIILKNDQPVELDYNIFFWRVTKLNDELDKHPQIATHIKQSLQEIISRYRSDNHNFVRERSWDGDSNDKTQVLGSLQKFIDKYLSKNLSKEVYKEYRKMIKYVESNNIKAALSIRVLVEELLDNESYISKGYFADNNPDQLKSIKENGWNALRQIGGVVENGIIVNFYEIMQKASKDPEFADKVNKAYMSVFSQMGDTFAVSSMKHEIDRWINIYQYDLKHSLCTRALKKVRGVKESNRENII